MQSSSSMFTDLPELASLLGVALFVGCSSTPSSSQVVGGAAGESTRTDGGTMSAPSGSAGLAGQPQGGTPSGGGSTNGGSNPGETDGGGAVGSAAGDSSARGGRDSGGSAGANQSTGGGASVPGEPKPSAGCVGGAGLAEGKNTLRVQNADREYVLRKPQGNAATTPLPLVLALHPNDNTTTYWDATTGNRALRPLLADKAILVLPQARRTGQSGLGDWRGDLPADLAYFDAVVSQLEANLCIDETRIFAVGFSGGGSFAGVLGCQRPDIRAFAAGGAVIYFEPSSCVGKPAAWITIGDDEDEPARLEYRDFFRSYAGCTAMSSSVSPAPCIAYACPDVQRPVQFCSHPGGHVWPSFGTQAAWDFFSKF